MTNKNLIDLHNLISSCSESGGVRTKTGECCFCGEAHFNGGHNPAPVIDDDDARCCDRCNIFIVLKARLAAFNSGNIEIASATKLAHWSNGLMLRGMTFCEETLYVKETGEYYLRGRGGGATKYGEFDGEEWDEGEMIVPLTIDEAKDWVNEKCSEKYEVIFGIGEKAV